MQIRSLPNEPELTDFLRSRFQAYNIDFVPLDNLQAPFPSVVLMFSPTWHNGIFVSIDQIWHNFLRIHSPQTVLITATFESDRSPNHLNLLDFPEDPIAFFKTALKCADLVQPFFSGGLEMTTILKKLYAGHGIDSIEEVMSRLVSILSQTAVHLERGKSYEEINQGLGLSEFLPDFWNKLRNRWHYYYPFLNILPFFQNFSRVNDLIEYLNPYFESGCNDDALFNHLECASNINQIKTLLDECWRYVETKSE